MRRFLFRRKVWKGIGLSILSIFVTAFIAFGYFWLTYVYISTPKEVARFESLGATLAGHIYYPNDESGPFPAVIILHGSEKETADEMGWKTLIKAYLVKGFAVMAYDKRGTGKSGGVFKRKNNQVLIADIYEAIDFLKKSSKIDSTKIGLMTNSESSSYGPQIASERKDLAFIYNRVGSVVGFRDLSMYQLSIKMMEHYKDSIKVKAIMDIYLDEMIFYINSDDNPAYYHKERVALSKKMADSRQKYGSFLPFGTAIPSSYNKEYIHRLANSRAYDPRVFFKESFDTPLFYAFAADLSDPYTNDSPSSLQSKPLIDRCSVVICCDSPDFKS